MNINYWWNEKLSSLAEYCFKIDVILTLCLSMCKGLRLGSKRSRCGSKFTGDCRLPLLHKLHSGLMSPQNAGPELYNKLKINTIVSMWNFKQSINKFTQIWKLTNCYISFGIRNEIFKDFVNRLDIKSLIQTPRNFNSIWVLMKFRLYQKLLVTDSLIFLRHFRTYLKTLDWNWEFIYLA